MTFQKRLQKCMKRRNMRVADIARWFAVPYTTAREWVIYGRIPVHMTFAEERLRALELTP